MFRCTEAPHPLQGDGMKPRSYDCDRCGACCKGLLIVEITELDVHREPRLKGAASPCRATAGMVTLDDDGEPCAPLEPGWEAGGILACHAPCPLLGPDDLCSIYPSRPNCCVAFEAGSELCQEARDHSGLPPLEPRP